MIDYLLLTFSALFLHTVIWWKFNFPVNKEGLRFRDWIKAFPKWKDSKEKKMNFIYESISYDSPFWIAINRDRKWSGAKFKYKMKMHIERWERRYKTDHPFKNKDIKGELGEYNGIKIIID